MQVGRVHVTDLARMPLCDDRSLLPYPQAGSPLSNSTPQGGADALWHEGP